jgi:hypothetical protein
MSFYSTSIGYAGTRCSSAPTDLPTEVRERTVALLAQLLRQHTRPRPMLEVRGE